MSRRRCSLLKHATYLACKRTTIPRSECNTGERWNAARIAYRRRALVHPFARRSSTSKPVAAIWTACRPRRRSVEHTGATNSTIQYYNPTSHRRRYRAVTAQHINRGVLSACASALFPALSRFLLDIPGVSLSTGRCLYPSPPSASPLVPLARFPFAEPPALPSPRSVSVRSRSVSVPPHRATISDWLDH